MRARKHSTWQVIRGSAEPLQSRDDRQRAPTGEYLSPWAVDRWKVKPSEISLYRSDNRSNKYRKPGDTFSEFAQYRDSSRFDLALFLRLGTVFLLIFSMGLGVILALLLFGVI